MSRAFGLSRNTPDRRVAGGLGSIGVCARLPAFYGKRNRNGTSTVFAASLDHVPSHRLRKIRPGKYKAKILIVTLAKYQSCLHHPSLSSACHILVLLVDDFGKTLRCGGTPRQGQHLWRALRGQFSPATP